MRKTRFFYLLPFCLLTLLAWLFVLNQAASSRLQEKKEYLRLMQAEQKKNREEADKKEIIKKESSKEASSEKKKRQMIRVLIKNEKEASYFHPSAALVLNGESLFYDKNTVESQGGTVLIPAEKNGIQLTSVTRQCGAPIYQGSMEIKSSPQGLLLINELPLEAYLEAVVPSEMPSYYEQEALKAQAVCARTYAWKQMQEGRLKEYGADVDDSVSFQVYGNILPQKETSLAVRETEGKILCFHGEPIQAYYFSTSAGATSTDEIWGAEAPAPYLKSVACTFDTDQPWRSWTTTVSWTALTERAAEKIGQKGELLAVAVTEKNESGAVTGLTVTTEAGSFVLDEEYSIREFLSPTGKIVTEKDGKETEGGGLLPSAYFTLKADPRVSFSITGGGYGHGVGMSQNAANQMAAEGYGYWEILKYFFKDVELGSTE